MSAVLAIAVLAAAAWFLLTVVGRPGRRRPTDSVSEFSRALTALDPQRVPQPALVRARTPQAAPVRARAPQPAPVRARTRQAAAVRAPQPVSGRGATGGRHLRPASR